MRKQIVIICLLIISIILIGTGVFVLLSTESLESEKNNADSTPTPTLDIPIEITNDTGYDVIANSIDNKASLGLLIQSNEENNQMLKVTVDLKNEKEEIVFSSEVYAPILGQSYYASNIPFVNEKGESLDVAAVHVSISKEGNYYTGLTSDEIVLNYDNQFEDAKLKTTLSLTYQGTVPIEDVSGSVVVLKDKKIVSIASFTQENIETGVLTNVTVPEIDFTGIEEIENSYDTVLVFINSFGFLA